jgi:hypothetical protein
MVLVLGALAVTNAAAADEPATLTLDASWDVKQVLTQIQEKGVAAHIQLHNGKEYAGRIGQVGKNAAILVGIQGKEYYDAFIPFESIAAIEARARNR